MIIGDLTSTDDCVHFLIEFAPHRLIAQERSTRARVDVPFHILGDRLYISFQSLQSTLPNHPQRFDILAQFDGDIGDEATPLHLSSFETFPVWRRYNRQLNAPAMAPHVYVNLQGNLSVVMRSRFEIDNRERKFRYEHSIERFRSRRESIHSEIKLKISEVGNFDVEQVTLQLYSPGEDCSLIAEHIVEHNTDSIMTIKSDVWIPRGTHLAPLRYFLFARLKDSESGASIDLMLHHCSKSVYEGLRRRLVSRPFALSQQRVLALSAGPLTTSLSFIIRRQELVDTQIVRQRLYGFMARLETAILRSVGVSRKSVALMFEKEAERAEDNAYALFEHLESSETPPAFQYFFIASRDRSLDQRLANNKRVLSKYSFKLWRLLASPTTFTLSSETRFHLATIYAEPSLFNKLLYLRKNYFLQHGVTGLKRHQLFNPKSHIAPDYVVATADWEKEIIASRGLPPNNIDVTGFPRWDKLHRTAPKPNRRQRILYMPTWRTWLEGANSAEVADSDFFHSIAGFVQDSSLQALLNRSEATLHVVGHPKMSLALKPLIKEFSGGAILYRTDEDFVELINNSDVLITDYSSILWDFLYVEKPVLLFQFDKRRYDEETGHYSHPELQKIRNQLITVENVPDLISELEFLLAEKHTGSGLPKPEEVFTYVDANNANRVIHAVEARLAELTVPRELPGFKKARDNT